MDRLGLKIRRRAVDLPMGDVIIICFWWPPGGRTYVWSITSSVKIVNSKRWTIKKLLHEARFQESTGSAIFSLRRPLAAKWVY